MYQGDEDIYRALEAGAATYLLKDTLSDDLVRVDPRGARRRAAACGRDVEARAGRARRSSRR